MSLAVLALAGVGVACAPTKPPAPPAPTQHCVLGTPDTAAEYQAAFDGLRNAGTDWRSSDGSLPVTLPDGRIVWMFGDTIVGSGNLGPRNSFVVQEAVPGGNCFRPILGPLPAPAPGQWLWPTAGVVEGNVLRVFALHMFDPPGQGSFDFAYMKMVVASFSLATLTHIGTTDVAIPTSGSLPSYGQTIVELGDGFLYAYGKTSTGSGLDTIVNHYVARVAAGQVTTGTWEVWDGTDWSTTTSEAEPIHFSDPDADPAGPDDGPRAPLAVSAVTGGFLGSALAWDVLSDQLETWDAAAPQGPFTFRALARDIWPTGAPANQFGYGGRVVFEIPGGPIALWSINHDTLIDPSVYKAIFAEPDSASVP